MKKLILIVTHLGTLLFGFGLGIYMLPILTAPPTPDASLMQSASADSRYSTEFSREREGSDFFHWGDGTVELSATHVVHNGELAPGPDYRLYLSPEYIETEQAFATHRSSMKHVGDVKTFGGFVVELPAGTDIDNFNTVIVWCETFGEFITSARYR